MNILVTGGFGYIGSLLTESLLKRDYHVTVLDNLMYRQTSPLSLCHHRNLKFVYGDVRNQELLKSLITQSDVVFPLAAIVGMPACDKDPELATAVNYYHVRMVAENAKRVIYPNTNSGYGIGQKDIFCSETTPLSPVSHYGQTKCDAEKCVWAKKGISLRLATVFGVSPRMRLDLLVNDFTYKACSDGYIVLFEKDFKRNYIHVRDVVKAFLFMLDNYEKFQGDVYNVGLSDANLSKLELALKIKEYVPNFSIQCDEIRSDKDKRNYIVSNHKIEGLGWKPDYTLDDGIVELVKAFPALLAGQQVFTNL